MEQPCVAQSMYIYKNPEIGSEGRYHISRAWFQWTVIMISFLPPISEHPSRRKLLAYRTGKLLGGILDRPRRRDQGERVPLVRSRIAQKWRSQAIHPEPWPELGRTADLYKPRTCLFVVALHSRTCSKRYCAFIFSYKAITRAMGIMHLLVLSGTLILISGLVVHRSEPNRSSKSRHVYTFHVVDVSGGKYSPENWLQPSEKLPFPNIYKYN